jgi:hypothetical protein
VGPQLFVIGGWANGGFHNDVHVLQTSTAVGKLRKGMRAMFGAGTTHPKT